MQALCWLPWSGIGLAAKPPDLPVPLGDRLAIEIVPAAEELSVISPIPLLHGLIGMMATTW